MDRLSEQLARQPDYYVSRDPEHPGKCAVFEAREEGPHQVVADNFDRPDQARRWIRFQGQSAPSERRQDAQAENPA